MKVTRDDVERLRSLAKYLRDSDSKLAYADRLHEALKGLDTAIALLDSGSQPDPVDFLLAAVLDAHEEYRPGKWRLIKMALLNWALTDISRLVKVRRQ